MGYLISTGIGFYLGKQTERRLHNVSEYLFPASTQSQLAISAFEEQIRYYNDLVMIGNLGNAINASREKAEEVQQALGNILKLKGLSSKRLEMVRNIQDRLKGFNITSLSTYKKINPEKDYVFEGTDEDKGSLENEIFLIGQQTNVLRAGLNDLTKQFSVDLKSELADISKITLHYRYLDIFLFISNLVLLAIIVSLILSKHVLRPIRQLTKGTQALTSLKFETRIDVNTRDELGQLASHFNMMAQTLKRFEQMQRQWITDISHELKTPLSILQAEIEAMQDGIREVNREGMDMLHTEVIYLGKIVDNLLQLSLAEAKTLYFKNEPVNPLHVLSDTINLFKNRLQLHHITVESQVETDKNIQILGDAERLKQVFSNILENTLRYTEAPGNLKVWQWHTKTRLFLYFEDSGPGVPEDSLDRLFDRLYRVDKSRSRAKGGSGLGLAISKNIIENHGGEIRANNALPHGLRIEITLPILSG